MIAASLFAFRIDQRMILFTNKWLLLFTPPLLLLQRNTMSEHYFSEQFNPRFCDTDALGHINNTMVPAWFEGARDPVFRWFSPTLDLNDWKLILAKIDVNFIDQMFYGQPMELRTYIGRIGGSSFDVYQEVWQHEKLCASGTAVMVHFDYTQQKSAKIPESITALMKEYLYQPNT